MFASPRVTNRQLIFHNWTDTLEHALHSLTFVAAHVHACACACMLTARVYVRARARICVYVCICMYIRWYPGSPRTRLCLKRVANQPAATPPYFQQGNQLTVFTYSFSGDRADPGEKNKNKRRDTRAGGGASEKNNARGWSRKRRKNQPRSCRIRVFRPTPLKLDPIRPANRAFA